MRETALFYVRQRTQDLLTQMAVSVQGYLALDSMKQTVTVLSDEVEKSKGYIARAEGQNQAQRQVAESGLLSIEG